MDVYEEIAVTQDRDSTERLLTIVISNQTSTVERDRLVEVLSAVQDPRAADVLRDLGIDSSNSEALREAAFDIVSATGCMYCDGETLRRWWASDDTVLRRWALHLADRTESDIIAEVADDPSHPLHRHAIETVTWGFEEPEWQRRKIAALSHPDAEVRAAAAEVLIWDEPLAAEDGLLSCTADVDDEVQDYAYDALKYYPSRKVVRRMAELVDDERARGLYDHFRKEYVDALRTATHYSPHGVAPLLEWMTPARELFKITDEEMVFRPGSAAPFAETTKSDVPIDELLEQLQDLGGKWAAKYQLMRDFDWSKVAIERRDEVAEILRRHVDPEVRSIGSMVLGKWGDTQRLVDLTGDAAGFVRKSAVYNLAFVPQALEVARLTWQLVEGGSVASTAGQEALSTYAAHALRDEVNARCLELIRSDRRESIRYQATSLLSNELVREVLYVLDEEPLVSWSVHSMILAKCATAKLYPSNVEQLWSVDSLAIASGLAALQEFRS